MRVLARVGSRVGAAVHVAVERDVGHRVVGPCQERAPVGERAALQRGHVDRLTNESDAAVVTLPYLFAPELGLPEYQLLADSLAESL